MNTALTTQDYIDRAQTHFVAPKKYSYLTLTELEGLMVALNKAYPNRSKEFRVGQYVSLACNPVKAARFVARVS